jgi:outer membrane protein assembly factor BamE (lipoprotein component of BamABCDE complex)
MRTLLAGLLVAALFGGCANSPRVMNKLSVGMSKADVIDLLGDPESTAAADGVEYLNYTFEESPDGIFAFPRPYFVRLVGGKVDAYGKRGDFDSTKTPASTVNVNLKKGN